MKFLLVVALLFFTGSCSVSSHQYYVSDNCSSVNYTNCKPLSEYGRLSDYSIYYFIGTSYTNYYHFRLRNVRNVTLLGLSHSPSIDCGGHRFEIRGSSYISIGNISFNNCRVVVRGSNHVMIADSTHHSPSIDCGGRRFEIRGSSNISIGNISFNNCSVVVRRSNHVMIADSTHHSHSIDCGGRWFDIQYSSYISIGNISFNKCSVEVYSSNHVMITDSTHHSHSIDCGGRWFDIRYSSYISIGNISFNNCNIRYQYSNHLIIADSTHYNNQQRKIMRFSDTSNITITNSIFQNFEISVDDVSDIAFTNSSCQYCSAEFSSSLRVTVIDSDFSSTSDGNYYFQNSFNMIVMSTVFTGGKVRLNYSVPLGVSCNSSQPQKSVILNNVSILDNELIIIMSQGTAYNVSVQLNHVSVNGIEIVNAFGFHSIHITNTTSSNADYGLSYKFNPTPFTQCTRPVADTNYYFQTIIEDSHFNNNRDYGIKIVNQNILIKSCFIENNTNIGLSIENNLQEAITASIVDTVMMGNRKNSISNSRNAFISNVTITDSLSTGLTVIYSKITINNTLILRNNTGANGGGISISQNSSLLLLPQALLEFISNHGSCLGGGIYYETTCPLYYADNSFQPVDDKYTPSVTFWNNTAVSGADVYGNLPLSIETCPQAVSMLSSLFQPCFCSSDNTNSTIDNCTKEMPEQLIFPGQNITFHVLMYSYDVNEGTYSPTDGKLDVVTNNVTQRESFRGNCSLIEFKPAVSSFANFKAQLFFHIGLDINEVTYFYETYEINITVKDCPIGFSRNSSISECSCSQSIAGDGVACDINTLTVSHNGRLWIGTNNTSTPFAGDSAFGHNETNCIIKETCLLYCSITPVTFSMNDTDDQCKDNRGHRMCGSCRDGYSLLIGSNKCGQCNNNYFITAGWIALFAVMGILLVVLLIALNLTVSVGTLNGLLFYANIVKLYEPVFSTQGAVPVLSQLVSWINLDIGIEACFYNGMGAYAKEWLQFAFPLYLWVIIIFIIYLCRKYRKISRLVGSNAVPVLSTLLLLSYTKLVRTIFIILHKRQITLHCTNVKPVTVWYEDPNVEYGKGKHAALLSVALFLLLFFVVPYTLFLLFHPFYEKYLSNFRASKKTWSRFKPVIDAYSGPMKDKYRFWPGLLLVARLALLLPVIFVDSIIDSKSFLLCMLLTVLAVLLSLYACFGGFYRQWPNGVLETWFLFNLSMMSALSLNFDVDGEKAVIFYNVCIAVFTVTFISIIIYHIHLQVSGMKWYLALLKKVKQICKKEGEVETAAEETEPHKTVDIQMSEIVPTSTVVSCNTRRDSVVDLFVD